MLNKYEEADYHHKKALESDPLRAREIIDPMIKIFIEENRKILKYAKEMLKMMEEEGEKHEVEKENLIKLKEKVEEGIARVKKKEKNWKI